MEVRERVLAVLEEREMQRAAKAAKAAKAKGKGKGEEVVRANTGAKVVKTKGKKRSVEECQILEAQLNGELRAVGAEIEEEEGLFCA